MADSRKSNEDASAAHIHPDLIELQLAHSERNEVRSAYNRAQRLAERVRMMPAWADYLDGLRALNAPSAEASAKDRTPNAPGEPAVRRKVP